MKNSCAYVVALVMTSICGTAAGSASFSQKPFNLISCRHGDDATSADRTRRSAALALARAINAAQGLAAQRNRRYQALSALSNLPPVPEGFKVTLLTDSSTYLFSIKDERDPCHYGIFSDQEGRLYETSPSVPQIASALNVVP